MKKITLFLLLFAVVLTTPSFAQDFYAGTGTEDDPFLISTPQHLDNIRKYLGKQHADKHFLIINEIDLDVPPYNGDAGWVPIGVDANGGSSINTEFCGKVYGYMSGLCGSGVIKNLKLVDTRDNTYFTSGMFARLGAGAFIRNIGLENCTVNSKSESVGILAGHIVPIDGVSTIENCYIVGNATCAAKTIGEITGNVVTGAIIKNCYTVCNLTNRTYADQTIGGICAVSLYNNNSWPTNTITNCYSKSNLDIGGAVVGSIAADAKFGTTISNCVGAGSITATLPSYGEDNRHRIVGREPTVPNLLHNNWALNTTTINGQLITGGTTTNADGQDTTLEALQSQSFYENVLGWDFDSTWMMPETKDEATGGFPVLQWQYNKEWRVILEEKTKEFDFGEIYLGDSVEQTATILNIGGLTTNLSIPPFHNSNFVPLVEELIIDSYSGTDYSIKFKPNEIGEFADTIQWVTSPCHVVYTVIVKGKCIARPPSHYTITASENELIETTRKNYPLQFYVTADVDSPETTISRLVVRLNKHMFHPRALYESSLLGASRLDNDNMKLFYDGDTLEITITNLAVPALKSDEQTSLFSIRGDILLGEFDSTVINISEIDFANANAVSLEDGFLTTLICSEGEDRLIENSDVLPGVVVEVNPPQDVLKVRCYCVERGDHTLSIEDLSGNSEILHEWRVNPRQQKEYTFEFPLTKYSNGNYYLIMKSPVRNYYDKVVISK